VTLNLAMRLYGVSESDREKMLKIGLESGKQYYAFNQGGTLAYDVEKPANANSEQIFPDFLLVMQPEMRALIANELRALMNVLPKKPEEAKYVLQHLIELGQAQRKAFVSYLLTLPEDAAERARLIEYLDYWNNDPRHLYRRGNHVVSVWFHVTNPREMVFVHGLVLSIILLFTLGVFTRVTSVLTWIAVLGYIHRTNQILFGMDTMMNILLIYLMIGNSGAALSVDRLIARYRAARASIRRCGTIDEPTRAFLAQAPPSTGANFGIRLIQVHFCFIYLASGCSKLLGANWWNGMAFWDVMINPEFTMMR
jgi:hypothetical protein